MGQGVRAAVFGAALATAIGGSAPVLAQGTCGFDIDDETLASEGAPLELLFGADDRRIMDSADRPWRAIGTLLTPGGRCTGTLVANALVLTAAHCVSAYVEGRIEASDVMFLAGYQDGSAFAVARATRIVPASNRPLQWNPNGDVSDDWAFVVLDQPIGAETGTIPILELGDDDLDLAVRYQTAVTQAGYSADIPESLTGHEGCRLLAASPGGWVDHDCDIVPGDSGSPLMVERDGRLQIIAVATAMQCTSEGVRAGNSAVDARAFAQTYRQLSGTDRVAVRVATPGSNNRSEERGGSGPRIVRICDTDC